MNMLFVAVSTDARGRDFVLQRFIIILALLSDHNTWLLHRHDFSFSLVTMKRRYRKVLKCIIKTSTYYSIYK